MGTRTWRIAAIGAAGMSLLLAAAPQVAARTTLPTGGGGITLREGDEAFWDGTVGGPLPAAQVCNIEIDAELACAAFPIEITEPGARLRVALERSSGYGADVSLTLVDPDGDEVPAEDLARDPWQSVSGFQSSEVFADAPAVGEWVARVTSRGATGSPFRMRAKLEAAPRERHHPTQLLPNLQVTPPFELTFATSSPHMVNGCLPDEVVESGPRHCLRFSAGPMNVGDGPLDLLYEGAGQLEGDIRQRIHWSDGSVEEVPGGTFHYHVNHGHYHHDSIGGNELLRVEPDGSLTQVSSTPKTGYCMGDYFIAEWRAFDNDAPRTVPEQLQSCGLAGPLGANLGLAKGWGDVYGWATTGNYVEFAGAGDGEYVVRMSANDDGGIVESDYDDNISYTHFRVTGTTIEVLERGIGTGPSDPRRTVFDDDYRLPLAP